MANVKWSVDPMHSEVQFKVKHLMITTVTGYFSKFDLEVETEEGRWYDNCRVTPLSGGEVEPVHRTRLWLNEAAGVILRNGLGLLGVSAPERM